MMERHGKMIILVLTLISLILLGWTLYLREKPHSAVPIPQQSDPDFKSKNMVTWVYSTDGDLLYKLQSDEVSYYKKNDETLFTHPIITMYDLFSKPEWKVTADHAKLSEKKVVYLSGDVKAANIGDNTSQIKSIQTTAATFDLNTQDICSQDKVTIVGNQFYSEGIGLKGNLKEKKATLLNEVNTYYE